MILFEVSSPESMKYSVLVMVALLTEVQPVLSQLIIEEVERPLI